MNYREQAAQAFSQAAVQAFGQEVTPAEALALMEVPPDPAMGDFAVPCFKLAKVLRKAPPAIAQAVAAAACGFAGSVQAAGPYVNFFVDGALFARDTLQAVFAQGKSYGGSQEGAGRVICLDYSSINIAKRFHVGHLYTTAIGNALNKVFLHLGYQTVSINHLGDWGTQFGKLIVAFRRWGDRAAIEADPLNALTAIYVRFHDEAEKDPALEDEARLWFRRIEEGDGEALALFAWFKELTLREANKMYQLLGITFDSYAGESFYNDKMGRVVEELRQKNLLKVDQGASIVDLSEEGMPPCLILKSDGATLYATRDIAAALYRADTYHFSQALYVVASHQELHFRQFFKVIEKMGYPWAGGLHHISYGMVSMEEGAMSTRKGRITYLDELLERSIEKTRAIIEEKSPDLPDRDLVARQVGVGAVLWAPLYNNRIKDIVFSWDRMLNFDGETAPYAMYTHARCCSVLRKARESSAAEDAPDYQCLAEPYAQSVVRALARFPAAVAEVAERYEPYLLGRFAIELCQAYNKFYYERRVLGEPAPVTAARLQLTRAARDVLALTLHLMGIAAPERM